MAESATDQADLDTEVTEPDGVEDEPQLDPEVAARRAAALAHVRKFGDPVLRTRARPVERFDDALRDEVARMGQLMNDAIGVGLAATQVGCPAPAARLPGPPAAPGCRARQPGDRMGRR